MGKVTNRTGVTSRGHSGLNPWNESTGAHSVLQLYLGSNFIAKLEIVSTLNSFNIAKGMYYYSYASRTSKYNPKVYFGTVQTTSYYWNYDAQNGQNWVEKSGSWQG